MSKIDPAFSSAVSNSEAGFQAAEVFYSRTDGRGVIRAGNAVFQRASGYEWSDLMAEPHKLLRHPDMPRGLFQLLWSRLKEGKPTAVYVKNRRKCGRFFWALDLISPSDGGYTATRLKPVSPLRTEVEAQYGEMLRREGDDGLSPEESADLLLGWIRGQGFPDYDTFQGHALATEFDARARQLGRQNDPTLTRFMDMSAAIADVWDEAEKMAEAFKSIRTVPMNMRIIASRLETAGGPISAISVNYSQMLEEMSSWVKTFVEGESCVFAQIRDAILTGQFAAFASALEHEMRTQFGTGEGSCPDDIDVEHEIALLKKNEDIFTARTFDSLAAVEREARRFAHSVQDMKRFVTGLSSTRMMCKIESASLSESGTALTGIVEQLDECQEEIEQRLARVMELNSVIQNNTAMLRSLV